MDQFGQKSHITKWTREAIEFSNRYFTVSKWLIRGNKDVFLQVERIVLIIMLLTFVLLLTIHKLPYWLGLALAILLVQRLLEFMTVSSRNFIFNKGRIFTEFRNTQHQGEWILLMFMLNVTQLTVIFAVWYRFISLYNPEAFSKSLEVMDSFYFSVVTLLTVGYGDIIPISNMAKALVIIQSALTFYIFVVVVNGLISIHFTKKY